MGSQQTFIMRGRHSEQINKAILRWEEIKDECTPIGQEGYYANAYLYKPLKLVIKRMKTARPKITQRQIYILDKLTPIFPNLCEYQLIEGNTLSGLSVKYFEGQTWDDLLHDEKSIFRTSPVARIRLIIKLGQIIKQIQGINICHGDIHVANMIIKVDKNSSVMDPQFQIFLIDYGNGFEFVRGQPVSEGLNGWDFLIPPEAAKKSKKNYESSGVNAYQFGRVVLHILLQKSYKEYNKISQCSDQEFGKLKTCDQYPIQLIHQVKKLVDDDIEARTKALVNLNLSKIQQMTRQIWIGNIKYKDEIANKF